MNFGREITSISPAQSHCGKNLNLIILGGFILNDSSSKPPLTIWAFSSSQTMKNTENWKKKKPQEISQYLLHHHTKLGHRMQSASLSYWQIFFFFWVASLQCQSNYQPGQVFLKATRTVVCPHFYHSFCSLQENNFYWRKAGIICSETTKTQPLNWML